MKKTFNSYIVIWAILLVLFNVITFVSPSEAGNLSKFGGAFWTGYIFITLAFLGQLAVSFIAFKAENLDKFFYKLPLIKISYTGLILTLVFGALCMAIPNLPNWVGIILCFIILSFNAISVVKANLAGEEAEKVEEKIKEKTFFIKSLTVDAETLMSKALSDEARAECKKVYEAIRYSDPMSNSALTTAEMSITLKFNEFSETVEKGDEEKIAELSKELVILIEDRNEKCKLLK